MVRKLHHVGVAVANLEEAVKAYEALGLAVEKVEVVETEGVKVAFLPVGETHLELLQPLSPQSPVARFLASRGPGLHHLCLEVEDLAHAMAQGQRAGLQLVGEAPRQGAGGAQVCFFHPRSLGGVLVELWQEDHA
jgi:methylmalonyl-CoA epimerase